MTTLINITRGIRAAIRSFALFAKGVLYFAITAAIIGILMFDLSDTTQYKTPPNPKPVSVIKAQGIFIKGDLDLERFRKPIDAAFKPKNLEAVVVLLDSPGGTPYDASSLTAYLRHKADERGVPLHIYVENYAASGGYWLAAVGDEVFVDPTSTLGSIGVVIQSFSAKELAEKLGVEPLTFTAGEQKRLGLHPLDKPNAEQEEIIQALLDSTHQTFISHVTQYRGDKLADDPNIFEAKIYHGQQAIDAGLADQLGNFWIDREKRYGTKEFTLYTPPKVVKDEFSLISLIVQAWEYLQIASSIPQPH